MAETLNFVVVLNGKVVEQGGYAACFTTQQLNPGAQMMSTAAWAKVQQQAQQAPVQQAAGGVRRNWFDQLPVALVQAGADAAETQRQAILTAGYDPASGLLDVAAEYLMQHPGYSKLDARTGQRYSNLNVLTRAANGQPLSISQIAYLLSEFARAQVIETLQAADGAAA